MDSKLKAALKAFLEERNVKVGEVKELELYSSSDCCNAGDPTLDINYKQEERRWTESYELVSCEVEDLLQFLLEYSAPDDVE